ncbi:MAG TPA: CBS domain-containing protein [Xanthobacteraceae bacterium]|nr:CBS domain-containing protein [Xanthobacteraceae bacterium]
MFPRRKTPMQVQEIMTRGAEVIDPNTTIRDAARKMRAKKIEQGRQPCSQRRNTRRYPYASNS